MKVLLIVCPPFWPKMPPLGLAYIATFLQSRGYEVIVRDLNITYYRRMPSAVQKQWLIAQDVVFQDTFFERYIAKDCDPLVDELSAYRADHIGFSVFRSNRHTSIMLAQAIKRHNWQTTIVFGGPEIRSHVLSRTGTRPLDARAYVDYLISGEGERAFGDLLQKVNANENPPFLLESMDAEPLDSLPAPTFTEFDLTQYGRINALPISASRGCIRRCSFCSERLLSRRFRVRSAEHLIHEIEQHYAERGITWFTFHDSLLKGDLTMLQAFCRLIIERSLPIRWEAQCLIRHDMSIELLALMKEAGCFNLFIGLESGSDVVLRLMNKGFTVAEAKTFLQRCADTGVHVEVSLIVGFPGEGEKEFEETCDFLLANKNIIPKIAQVNPFILLPGTDVERHRTMFGIPADVRDYYVQAKERMNMMKQFLEDNTFIVTPSFIGNLLYEEDTTLTSYS